MAQQYFSNRDNTDSLTTSVIKTPKKAKIVYISKKGKPELTKKEKTTLSKGAKKLQQIVNHRRKIRDERKTPILSLDQIVKRKQLIDKLNKKNGFNITESALDNVLQKPAPVLPAIMPAPALPAIMPAPAMMEALKKYLKPKKQQKTLQTPQKQKQPRGRPLKLNAVELKTREDERVERLRRYNPVELRNIAIHHNVNVRKNATHENVIKAVMNHEKLNNLRLDGDRFVDVIPSSSQSAEQINKDDYDDFSKEKDDYDDDDDDDDDADDTIAVVEQNLDVPVGELAVAENNTDVAAAMGEHTVSWSGSFNAAKNQPLPESDDELGAGLVVRRRKQMMHGKGLVSGGGLGDFLSGLASKAIDFVKKDPIGALKKAVSIGQDAFKYGKEAHGVYKKYFSGKEKGGMLKGCTEKFKKKYIHHAYKLHKFISKA